MRNIVENDFNYPVLIESANSPVINGLYLFQISLNPYASRVRIIMKVESNLRVVNCWNLAIHDPQASLGLRPL